MAGNVRARCRLSTVGVRRGGILYSDTLAATSGHGVVPARHGFAELRRVAGEVGAAQLVEAVTRAKVGSPVRASGTRPSAPSPVRPGDVAGFSPGCAGYSPVQPRRAPGSTASFMVAHAELFAPPSRYVRYVCVSVGSGELVCSSWAPVLARVDGFMGIPGPLLSF